MSILSWWIFSYIKLLRLVTSYISFSWWLSVSARAYLPPCFFLSLRELHQALRTWRMCQEPSFKLAMQSCPWCVTASVALTLAVTYSLGVLPLLLLQWSVPPCHACSLHSLVAVALDNTVKGQRWKYWNAVRKYCWSEEEDVSMETQRCHSSVLQK